MTIYREHLTRLCTTNVLLETIEAQNNRNARNQYRWDIRCLAASNNEKRAKSFLGKVQVCFSLLFHSHSTICSPESLSYLSTTDFFAPQILCASAEKRFRTNSFRFFFAKWRPDLSHCNAYHSLFARAPTPSLSYLHNFLIRAKLATIQWGRRRHAGPQHRVNVLRDIKKTTPGNLDTAGEEEKATNGRIKRLRRRLSGARRRLKRAELTFYILRSLFMMMNSRAIFNSKWNLVCIEYYT